MSRFQPIPINQGREVPAQGSPGLTQVSFIPPRANNDLNNILGDLTSALRGENQDREKAEYRKLKLSEQQQKAIEDEASEEILKARQKYNAAAIAYSDAQAAGDNAAIMSRRAYLTNATLEYSTILSNRMEDESLSTGFKERLTSIYSDLELSESERNAELRKAREDAEQKQLLSGVVRNIDTAFGNNLTSGPVIKAIAIQNLNTPLNEIREDAWNRSYAIAQDTLEQQGFTKEEAEEYINSPSMQNILLARVNSFMGSFESTRLDLQKRMDEADLSEAINGYRTDISQAVLTGDLAAINQTAQTLSSLGIEPSKVYSQVNSDLVGLITSDTATDYIINPNFITQLDAYLSLPNVPDAAAVRNTWKNRVLDLAKQWPIGGVPFGVFYESTAAFLDRHYKGNTPTYMTDALREAAAKNIARRPIKFADFTTSSVASDAVGGTTPGKYFFDQYQQEYLSTGMATPTAKKYLEQAAIEHVAEYDTYNALDSRLPEYDEIRKAGLDPQDIPSIFLFKQAMKNGATANIIYGQAASDEDRMLLRFMASHDWEAEMTIEDFAQTRQRFIETIGVVNAQLVRNESLNTITLARHEDPLIKGLTGRERDVVLYHAALQYQAAGSPDNFDFKDQFKKSYKFLQDGLYISKSGYLFMQADLPIEVSKPGGLKDSVMTQFYTNMTKRYFDSNLNKGVAIESDTKFDFEFNDSMAKVITPYAQYFGELVNIENARNGMYDNAQIQFSLDGKRFATIRADVATAYVASNILNAATTSLTANFNENTKAPSYTIAAYLMGRTSNNTGLEVVKIDYDHELALGEVMRFQLADDNGEVKVVTIPGSIIREMMYKPMLPIKTKNLNLPWDLSDAEFKRPRENTFGPLN